MALSSGFPGASRSGSATTPTSKRGKLTCTECGEKKSVKEFQAQPKSRSGYTSKCTLCNRKVRFAGHMARKGMEVLPCKDHEKQCSSCGQVKRKVDYHNNEGTYDGLHSRCKDCNIGGQQKKRREKSAAKRATRTKPVKRAQPVERVEESAPAPEPPSKREQAQTMLDAVSRSETSVQVIARAMASAGLSAVQLNPVTGEVSATAHVTTSINLHPGDE